MDNHISTRLEPLVKSLPLLSGFLIFLGTLNAIVFYSTFDINILEYISFSEAILYSLKYCFIFFVIPALLLVKIPASFRRKNIFGSQVAFMTDEEKEKILIRKLFRGAIAIAVFAEVAQLVQAIILDTKSDWYQFITYSIIYIVIVIASWLFTSDFHTLENRFDADFAFWVMGIFLSSIGIIGSTIGDSIVVKYAPPIRVAIISLKDKTSISTTDSLVYVGKVDKYLFLYDKISALPEIISSDEVVSIKWVKRKK